MNIRTALISAALTLTLAMAAGAQAATSKFKSSQANGAIAYHRDSGSYGYSVDLRSSREAKTEALKQCGHTKCEVVESFRKACGAVANGPKRSASATGAIRQEAETRALRKCGEACQVVVWACTK
jgi:serine/threonine-protein kinase